VSEQSINVSPVPGAGRAPRIVIPYAVVRWVVALLLLGAAGLKAYALLTGPAVASAADSRWLFAVLVEAEVVLALLLLDGRWVRFVRAAAMVCFAAFAAVAAYKAFVGETSCGCFGRVPVDPRLTLVVDLLVVGLLAVARVPKQERVPRWRTSLLVALGAMVTIGLPVGLQSTQQAMTAHETVAGVYVVDGTTVLEPAKWMGGRFPSRLVEHGESLASGTQVVMFYHHDCARCQRTMPQFLALCRGLAEMELARGALIEVPPRGAEKLPPGHVELLQLSADREWMVETPTVVLLSEGRVVGVWALKAPEVAEVQAALKATPSTVVAAN